MLNSQTLRDAITVGNRYGYGNLSFVFIRPLLEYRPHDVRFVLDSDEVPHDVRDFIIEQDLAAQTSSLRRLVGSSGRCPGARGASSPHRVALARWRSPR